MRYKVIILTGNELRHQYFRTILSNEDRFDVVSTISEDTRKSLGNRTKNNPYSSLLESQHVLAREQSEQDMFGDSVSLIPDKSNPIVIPKGTINDDQIVQRIYNYNPDILVCYG